MLLLFFQCSIYSGVLVFGKILKQTWHGGPIIFVGLGPGKIGWKAADVSSMAVRIKTTLPLGVTQVIGADTWKGGPLVQLDDAITRPGAEDLVLNACWVRPFVERFRDRVPSQFFVVDTFLFLDKLHLGRLLQPSQAGESKQSLAAEGAKKIKLLIGALRSLWRSSDSHKLQWFFFFYGFFPLLVVPIIVGLFNSHFFAMLAIALRQDWWTSSHHWLEVAIAAITKPYQGWGKGLFLQFPKKTLCFCLIISICSKSGLNSRVELMCPKYPLIPLERVFYYCTCCLLNLL